MSGEIPVVHHILHVPEEFITLARRGPSELRAKRQLDTPETENRAKELFLKAKSQLKEEDPFAFHEFFGEEDAQEESLQPFSKKGHASRLYIFGFSHKSVMKIWGGERVTHAMIDTTTKKGYMEFLEDQEKLGKAVEIVNNRHKSDLSSANLDHFLMEQHTFTWIPDDEDPQKGTLVEFSPLLEVGEPSEIDEVNTPNTNLPREMDYIREVQKELKKTYGLGLDLVDRKDPTLLLAKFKDRSYHYRLTDYGLEHSMDKKFLFAIGVFGLTAAIVLGSNVARNRFNQRKRISK